jgi:hypothetical protein
MDLELQGLIRTLNGKLELLKMSLVTGNRSESASVQS